MIFLKDNGVTIEDPTSQTISVEIKNQLHNDLDKGHSIFVIPDDFDNLDVKNVKKHKKVYKVGFLYDLLGIIYADYGKEDRHKIISEKYHLFFTYRQFKDVLDEYEKNRSRYIKARHLLQSF